MDVQDKIYYLRLVIAAIAGSILGVIIQPKAGQSSIVEIIILLGIVFYGISYIIAKRLASGIPSIKQGKLISNGIFAYIFMLVTFMVIIYTVLHQGH